MLRGFMWGQGFQITFIYFFDGEGKELLFRWPIITYRRRSKLIFSFQTFHNPVQISVELFLSTLYLFLFLKVKYYCEACNKNNLLSYLSLPENCFQVIWLFLLEFFTSFLKYTSDSWFFSFRNYLLMFYYKRLSFSSFIPAPLTYSLPHPLLSIVTHYYHHGIQCLDYYDYIILLKSEPHSIL